MKELDMGTSARQAFFEEGMGLDPSRQSPARRPRTLLVQRLSYRVSSWRGTPGRTRLVPGFVQVGTVEEQNFPKASAKFQHHLIADAIVVKHEVLHQMLEKR